MLFTPDENSGEPSQQLPDGPFSGRVAFGDAIRQALQAAEVRGWKEIMLCDANFADWPLGERAVIQSLNGWSARGRKFTMLAGSFDAMLQKHPRFVVWRKTWDHLIDCRRIAARRSASIPSAIWTPEWVMERIDAPRCIGTFGSDAGPRVRLQEQLNELVITSTPAFPATVLGL